MTIIQRSPIQTTSFSSQNQKLNLSKIKRLRARRQNNSHNLRYWLIFKNKRLSKNTNNRQFPREALKARYMRGILKHVIQEVSLQQSSSWLDGTPLPLACTSNQLVDNTFIWDPDGRSCLTADMCECAGYPAYSWQKESTSLPVHAVWKGGGGVTDSPNEA